MIQYQHGRDILVTVYPTTGRTVLSSFTYGFDLGVLRYDDPVGFAFFPTTAHPTFLDLTLLEELASLVDLLNGHLELSMTELLGPPLA